MISIQKSMMIRAKQNESEVNIISGIMTSSVLFSYVIGIYQFVFKQPENNVVYETATYVLSLFSDFANDFVNIMLQFSFFTFCVQICSCLDQFEQEILELNFECDKNELKKKIRATVQNHLEILEIYSTLMFCFHSIVSLNFLMNTWFIGQALVFSHFSNWFYLFYITPFMVFDSWIYCFAAQRVKSKV